MTNWRIDSDGVCHFSCKSNFKDKTNEYKTYFLQSWGPRPIILPYCFYCREPFPTHFKLQVKLMGIDIKDVMQDNE